jgi:hypothetical protein
MLALRHWLAVLEQSVTRPQCSPLDRCWWIVWSTLGSCWPPALASMPEDTIRRWRRHGVRYRWRWLGGSRVGGSGQDGMPWQRRRVRIGHLNRDNALWGAPRLHGAVARHGSTVSRPTVAQYMIRRPYRPSPMWRTCLCNHASERIGREVSAELLQRVCALSARRLMALRWWLDRRVAGERPRDCWYGRYGAVIPLHSTE